MKATLSKSAILFMLAMLLSACSNHVTKKDLIGKWVDGDFIPTQYTFNENGTGVYGGFGSRTMTWTMTGDTIDIILDRDDKIWEKIVVQTKGDTVIEDHRIKILHMLKGSRKYSAIGRSGYYTDEYLQELVSKPGWILSKKGTEWLASEQGQKWLKSPQGQKWLRTPEGQEYQKWEFRPIVWFWLEDVSDRP